MKVSRYHLRAVEPVLGLGYDLYKESLDNQGSLIDQPRGSATTGQARGALAGTALSLAAAGTIDKLLSAVHTSWRRHVTLASPAKRVCLELP